MRGIHLGATYEGSPTWRCRGQGQDPAPSHSIYGEDIPLRNTREVKIEG